MWHKPRQGSMCAYRWARTSTYSLLKSWSTSSYMRKTVTAVNVWLLHNLFKFFYRCRQTLVLEKLGRTKQHNHQIYRTVRNMSKAYRPTGTSIYITNYQQQQMDLSNLWPSLLRRIPATPSLMWHSLRDYVKTCYFSKKVWHFFCTLQASLQQTARHNSWWKFAQTDNIVETTGTSIDW